MFTRPLCIMATAALWLLLSVPAQAAPVDASVVFTRAPNGGSFDYLGVVTNTGTMPGTDIFDLQLDFGTTVFLSNPSAPPNWDVLVIAGPTSSEEFFSLLPGPPPG